MEMIMQKMLVFLSIFILVIPLTAARAADQDFKAEQTGKETTAAFSLSPYSPEPTFKLVLNNPYVQTGSDTAESQSRYVMPVEPIPRNVGVAIAETVGINILVWAFGQYVMDQESGAHSYINLDTMQSNLRLWYEWDPNHFTTNFFAHPYHGGLYYSAGRTNGLDFWASSFCAFGGSFMWEVFMEHHRPSINDLAMTTTGGMFLGEALFRFSNLVWDDSATGFERVWREIVGTIINPIGGLNRIIRGDISTTRSTHNQIRAPVEFTLFWAGALSSGSSDAADEEDIEDQKLSNAWELFVLYGKAFRGGETRKPFDWFALQWSGRKTDQLYFSIYAYSLLLGKEFKTREGQKHMVGLFQHYDYIYNESIKLGGTSFTPGFISQFDLSKTATLSILGHFGWMLMGASNNEYVVDDLRDYNYGTGITAKVDLALNLQKYGQLIFRWGHYTIYSLEGADGTDRLNLFQLRVRVPIWRGLGLGGLYTVYRRNSHYDNFPDVKRRLHRFDFSVSYRF
jgi:hypothetical protein